MLLNKFSAIRQNFGAILLTLSLDPNVNLHICNEENKFRIYDGNDSILLPDS